jgi:hypothetical protein
MSNSIEQKFKVGDTILVPAVITEVDLDSPEYKLSLLDGNFLWATKETLSQCSSDTVPEPNRAMIAAMPFYEETVANGIEWYRTEPFGNWMPKPFRSVEGANPDRAMIAAMCLQGFIANGEWDGNVIEVSVQYADALIAELQKPKP